MLAANKTDLAPETWQIDLEEVKEFTNKNSKDNSDIMFSLVSAKNGSGVEQAMIDLTKQINQNVIQEEHTEDKLEEQNFKKKLLNQPTCC